MRDETWDSDRRLRLLYESSSVFAQRREMEELLPLVAQRGREAFDADGVSILLLDPDTDELYFPWVAEEDPRAARRLLELRMPGDVLRHGKPTRIDDVSQDERFFGGADEKTQTTTRAMLAAPLIHQGGRIGVLEVIRRSPDTPFCDRDLELVVPMAASVAIAIENARLYAELRESQEKLLDRVGVLQQEVSRQRRSHQILGNAPAMEQFFRLLESAGASPISVLIQGETGTGKELTARAVHEASARAEGPFVAVNCAALPETLLESELFGHRKGAFTGADADRRGLFEAAHEGTIFLDEIGDMPAVMQAKLLRVLQEGEVVPVGDTKPRKVDVRVVSATHRDLGEEVAAKRFREDLFYRLAAFPLAVPPLRERREDIALLVDAFLQRAADNHGKQIAGITPQALRSLESRDWPGNIRQLQNEVERAVALTPPGQMIEESALQAPLTKAPPTTATAGKGSAALVPDDDFLPMREARALFEADYVTRALERSGGNVTRAAAELELSRFMVQKKIKDYGLRRDS
jgi:sigma-54-dependent transcriptional regulator